MSARTARGVAAVGRRDDFPLLDADGRTAFITRSRDSHSTLGTR